MLNSKTERSAEQQPPWPDPALLHQVIEQLETLPGLVTEEEVEALGENMDAVARGDSVLLHGGDCAEPFEDSHPDRVALKVGQLTSLASLMRGSSGSSRVTMIGRIAGQHAKPRSQDYESDRNLRSIPVYRGDAVNSPDPDIRLREPDPKRLLRSYRCSALALSALRESWRGVHPHERVFASHELLLLDYERALLRKGAHSPYAASAHFGWVGDRTRSLSGSHIGLASSARNPVGVKLGPGTDPHEVVALTRKLNPEKTPGRLVLIARMGVDNVDSALPRLVREVRGSGAPVIWVCDPMHGNTYRSAHGVKTRSVGDIQQEAASFVRVLRSEGARPAGLSLEVTPDRVTECVWDREGDHFPRYWSACDPRLDPAQAEAVVEAFAAHL